MGSGENIVLSTGRPFNLGASTSTGQWSDGNSSRMFPLCDDAGLSSRIDGGPDLPEWFLSDACVVVPTYPWSNLDQIMDAVVLSAHASPHMVSVSIGVVEAETREARTDSSVVLGDYMSGVVSSCVCTVLAADFEPHRPYPLVPVDESYPVCGSVSFGDVLPYVSGSPPTTWKPRSCRLSPSALSFIPTGKFLGFVDDRTGERLTGDIRFVVHDGIRVSTERESETGVMGGDKAVFSLDPDLAAEIRRKDIDALYGLPSETGGPFNGVVGAIKSINGVKPDSRGRIAIVFE